MNVTAEDIEAAAHALAGAVVRTPILHSRLLSELSGAALFLKMENLQYTASFKERGALVKLLTLDAEQRRRGVIAMSAGNHAQGIAYHAQRLGIPATIVMPKGTPFVKVAHTRYFGAQVLLQGHDLTAAAAWARELAAAEGLTFVHPYDDASVIAGQGTVALEMLEDVPELDTLVIPVGGGGLIAGCAIAAKARKPAIRVIGVQNELYACMLAAVKGVRPGGGGATIAEGIAVTEPGTLTRAIVAQKVDELLTVRETDIESAIQMLVEIEKTVAEGAGAAGLAAVFAHRDRFRDRNVGLVIGGGNLDPRLLASVLMRGLVRQGRLIRLRVPVSDAPGNLARVANLIGDVQGNIIEISHQRLFLDVPIKMTELDLVIETRDPAHVQELLTALSAAGFAPRLLGNTTIPAATPPA